MVKAIVLNNSVIVAGHPRSGTSLVCQLVESADVEFPSDFEGDEYNKEGYYELESSKELSKQLMSEAMTEENTEQMNEVVRRLNGINKWSGLKLVRISALFFYRHVAKNLKLVGVFRKPANVKASLFRRGLGEFPVPWIKNNNALIAGYENIENSIFLSYESLLTRPSKAKRAFDSIDLDINTELIDAQQQTQQDSKIYCTDDELNLYDRLKQIEQECF